MCSNRPVFTSAAVLSPLGIGFESFRRALHQGTTRFAPITLFGEHNALPSGILGGQVWDFDPIAIMGRKGLRTLDRNTRLVLSCIQHDLSSTLERFAPSQLGLVIGTQFGSLPSLEAFTKTYLQEGFRALNPRHFPNLVINSPPSQGNIRFGLTASSTTIANGTTSGIDAIQFAAQAITQGSGVSFVCGASEELSESLCYTLYQNQMLSEDSKIRPFKQPSTGTLPSEGTALFILESAKQAQDRGTEIWAELLAWSTCYGGGWAEEQKPSAEAGIWAIQNVLKESGIDVAQLDFINVSADGSQHKDAAEYEMLRSAFGVDVSQLPVVAPAAYWGHAGATSSAFQVASALADLRFGTHTQIPHPVDSTHDGLHLSPPTRTPRCGLVVSLGDTGTASALLLQTPN